MNPTRDRIVLIDSLRALALFGVIVMNVGAMVMRFNGDAVVAAAGPVDISLLVLDFVVLGGKARAAFAFLFGLGFAILMLRAEAKGTDFNGFYVRRMLALAAFGVVNQVFLFWGDILLLYAVLGLLLLPIRHWPDARLLVAGLTLVALPPIVVGLLGFMNGGAMPGLVTADEASQTLRGLAAITGPDYRDFVAFSWSQAIERRLTETPHMLVYDLSVLGLFLLGIWTARRGLLFNVAAHRATLRRIAMVALPLGLVLSIVATIRVSGLIAEGPLHALGEATALNQPLLAFGYIAALSLWFERGARRLQGVLAPAGQMALSNYLLSGAIGCFIFYGYGLGLLKAVGGLEIHLIALALIGALTAFSHAWLARFRYGPAEWLWRCLSHGERQPLRRQVPAAAAA